jgi:hypothetical protein
VRVLRRRRKSSGKPRHVASGDDLFAELRREIADQHSRFGSFVNERASLRLGFACLEDELREAIEAYEDDRHDDFCGLGFAHTQEELLQVAAVAIRLLAAFPNKYELPTSTPKEER